MRPCGRSAEIEETLSGPTGLKCPIAVSGRSLPENADLRGLDALRVDALDGFVCKRIDQIHAITVVGLEIPAFQRHTASAKSVVFRDQLLRHLRVLHALADLPGDEIADGGVGFLVNPGIAEIAQPDAEAGFAVQLLPERLALLRRHLHRLAGVRLVNEPHRRRGAVGIDLVIAGLDPLHLFFADLGVVQRRGPVRAPLEDGELLRLLGDLGDGLNAVAPVPMMPTRLPVKSTGVCGQRAG